MTTSLEYTKFPYTEDSNVTSTLKPELQGDDVKYLIVPIIVVVVVLLLSLLVYFMVKKRRMNRLRQDIARLYHFDEKELEWEALSSYEHPFYNSTGRNPSVTGSTNYMPTTNL